MYGGAFLSHSKLSSNDAKAALAWGDGPLLLTGDLGSANGFFDPAVPNAIKLSSEVTKRFEADFELPKAQLLAESTILHEMIHWSYKKLGLDDPDDVEIGREFEVACYGADIDRYWLVSATATEKPRPQLIGLNKNLPRGIRNNNPGNIRVGEKWLGLSTPDQLTPYQQKETAFCVFSAPRWGIRAMAKLLMLYQDRYNLDTVAGMIGRWAPPNENDSKAYARTVAKAMQVDVSQSFPLGEYRYAHPMIKAMITVENGQQPYTDEQIDAGLVLAGIETPLMAVS